MSGIIIAIDPGTTQSGWVEFDHREGHGIVRGSGVIDNEGLLEVLRICGGARQDRVLAIEMIASYGMAVGREVFETCVWIGRFQQAWPRPKDVRFVYRQAVKLHLCGSARAKDPNIRQALLDRIGQPGTKKAPGPTFGVKSHAWSALAVAVTAAETAAA